MTNAEFLDSILEKLGGKLWYRGMECRIYPETVDGDFCLTIREVPSKYENEETFEIGVRVIFNQSWEVETDYRRQEYIINKMIFTCSEADITTADKLYVQRIDPDTKTWTIGIRENTEPKAFYTITRLSMDEIEAILRDYDKNLIVIKG